MTMFGHSVFSYHLLKTFPRYDLQSYIYLITSNIHTFCCSVFYLFNYNIFCRSVFCLFIYNILSFRRLFIYKRLFNIVKSPRVTHTVSVHKLFLVSQGHWSMSHSLGFELPTPHTGGRVVNAIQAAVVAEVGHVTPDLWPRVWTWPRPAVGQLKRTFCGHRGQNWGQQHE